MCSYGTCNLAKQCSPYLPWCIHARLKNSANFILAHTLAEQTKRKHCCDQTANRKIKDGVHCERPIQDVTVREQVMLVCFLIENNILNFADIFSICSRLILYRQSLPILGRS